MTNTLHRFGKPEGLKDDYIVFVMDSRDINDQGSPAKVRSFLKTAEKYRPVNMGTASIGSMFRPEKDLSLTKVYLKGREEKYSARRTIEDFNDSGSATVVFDNKEAMEAFIKDIKKLDLGLSVNVSALAEDTKMVCKNSSIKVHSVEYSLGFQGDLYRLPDRHVLELTTMCGHGMISANFAQKLINHIKEARLTPEKAATYMAKFCVCGAFNTTRAIRILNDARVGN